MKQFNINEPADEEKDEDMTINELIKKVTKDNKNMSNIESPK